MKKDIRQEVVIVDEYIKGKVGAEHITDMKKLSLHEIYQMGEAS